MKLPRGHSPIRSLSLVLTGLLFLFFAVSAAPPPPPTLTVKPVSKTFEPSPTCVHENVIAKFMISFDNPAFKQEAMDKGIEKQKFTFTFGEAEDGKITSITLFFTLKDKKEQQITFTESGENKDFDLALKLEPPKKPNKGVVTGGDKSPVIVMVIVTGEFSKAGHKKIALAAEVQPKTAKEPAKGEGSVEGDVGPSITLASLTFSNGFDLTPDTPGENKQPKKYTGPHWEQQKEGKEPKKWPHAFVRDDKMKVKAIFTFTDPKFKNAGQNKIFIRGAALVKDKPLLGLNGKEIVFDPKETFSPKDQFEIQVEATIAFLNKVTFYEPLILSWEASLDKKHWCPAGKSENLVYLLFDKPSQKPKDPLFTILFQTVVDYGSRTDKELSTAKEVFDNIWSKYTDRKAKRAFDGKPLGYYMDWRTPNQTVADLLLKGDGECNAFQPLLFANCNAQALVKKVPKPVDPKFPFEIDGKTAGPIAILPIGRTQGVWFLINTWTFKGNPPFENYLKKRVIPPGTNPVLAAQLQGDPVLVPNKNEYEWLMKPPAPADPQVLYTKGTPGQNQDMPPAAFNNHCIFRFDDTLYDPSYGVTYPPAAAGNFDSTRVTFQNTVLAGFYKGKNIPKDHRVFQIEKSPMANWNNGKPQNLKVTFNPLE